MNNKAIADDWRIRLAMPLFLLIDALLRTPPVARFLFDKFRSRDTIRQVLQNVYGERRRCRQATAVHGCRASARPYRSYTGSSPCCS